MSARFSQNMAQMREIRIPTEMVSRRIIREDIGDWFLENGYSIPYVGSYKAGPKRIYYIALDEQPAIAFKLAWL